jgi:glycosyltransferase involved in cell wall biosynthesis
MGLIPFLKRVPGIQTSLVVWSEQPKFGQLAQQVAGVSAADVDSCLEEQRHFPKRLGEIMRKRGLLSQAQVREILTMQARWTVKALEAIHGRRLFPYRISLSLCMPAFNEEEVIEDTIDAAVTVLAELVQHFEVVVVDDGSRDRTAEVIARYAARDPRVRLIRHPKNRGYGGAVTTGLKAARHDFIMFSDSDGQFSFLDLAQLLIRKEGCDIVIGYRYKRADHWVRRVNGWGWTRLIHLLLGVPLHDLDCAFKLFPRQVIEQMELTIDGQAINAQMMAQCVRGHLRIRQTPVRHYPRYSGVPTGAARKVIVRAFYELPPLLRYRTARIQFALPETPCPEARANDIPLFANGVAANGHGLSKNGNGHSKLADWQIARLIRPVLDTALATMNGTSSNGHPQTAALPG